MTDAIAPAVAADVAAQQQANDNASDQSVTGIVVLSLKQRVRRLKVVFLLIFLLGGGAAASAPNIPNMIVDTFGGNAYVVNGLFAGVKGLLACVYIPAIGSLSDGKSRRTALIATQVLSMVAYGSYLASQNFWAFVIVDTIFGLSSATLALLMTCVTDFIPPSCPARTESFAMTMFVFFVGVAIGPIASAFVSVYMSFVIALVTAVAALVVTFFMLPPESRYREEDEEIVRKTMEAERTGHCPVLPSVLLHGYGATTTALGTESKCPYHRQAATTDAKNGVPAAATAVNVDPADEGEQQSMSRRSNADDADEAVDGDEAPLVAGSAATSSEELEDDGATGWVAAVKRGARRMKRVFFGNRPLQLVLAIVFWSCLCQEALEANLQLYLKKRLGYTSHDFVPFIAIVSLSGLVSLGVVVPVMRRIFGTSKTLMLCIAGNVCFALSLAFVFQKWQGYAVCIFGIVGYGVYPCSSTLVAHSVPQHSAGTAQGILNGVRMLSQGIGPVIFGIIFNATEHTELPGTPYLIGAVCGVVGVVTAFVVRRKVVLP